MDNGGSIPDDKKLPNDGDFELEVNEKDVDFVSADIESPAEDGDLPTDDSEIIEGDLPAPDDEDLEVKPEDDLETLETEDEKPEEKPEDEPEEKLDTDEPKEDEPVDEPKDEEPVEEKSELESEEPEEAQLEAEPEEEKPEEEPKDEESADEPAEEPLDEPKDEESEEEKAEEEASEEETTSASEDEPAEEEKSEDEKSDDEPTEEEKPEEEKAEEDLPDAPVIIMGTDGEKAEDEPAEEEKSEDDKSDEAAAAVVAGAAVAGAVEEKKDGEAEKAEGDKERKKNPVLGIIIGIIVLLLLGVGIFFAMGGLNKKPEDKKEEKKDEPTAELTKLDGLTEFDIKLLKTLSSKKNIVYSPMSIKYALSMLADGSDGDSKKQITDALGGEYDPKEYKNSKHLSVANVIFVRDEFKSSMKQAYLDLIKEKYGANAIYDPFNNASSMNDWAYKNTLSLIPKVLDDDEVKDLDFILMNAVAIDMNWNNLIQCELLEKSEIGCLNGYGYSVDYAHEKYSQYVSTLMGNRESYDYNGKTISGLKIASSINNYDIISELGEEYIYNTVKADYTKWYNEQIEWMKKYSPGSNPNDYGYSKPDDYMNDYMKELKANYGRSASSTDYRLHVDDDVKIISKKLKEYDGLELEYIAIMPRKKALDEYIKGTSVDSLKETVKNLKDPTNSNFKEGVVTKIEGFVPEFNYKNDYDLTKVLPELGVKDVFEPEKADLSNMTDSGDYIKIAKHSAMIDFGNEGIKAAGVTTMGGAGNGGDPYDYLWDVPVEEIDITFDKPYMYLISDKASGEVWFMGTVYEPVNKN